MATPYATIEGSLYELVSRGRKDTFFFDDTKPESIFPFDSTYEAQAPHTSEIRRIPPNTACEFGRTIHYDFDLVGDILRNPTLVINLPSWLPPAIEASNPTTFITDASGFSYGYTNAIAYFLFEQIQFYQDNILIQEFSGDSLWASTAAQGTVTNKWMTNSLTGQHDGAPLDIARNATPGQLRLALPIIGCQANGEPGFPQRAVLAHTYRLRCKIRRLEDLIESSDASSTQKPQPWDKPFTQSNGTTTTSFNTMLKTDMRPLDIQLETRQVYIPREYQDVLQKTPQKISFVRQRENIFTQNKVDYTNVLAGGTSTIKRLLDGRHPTERVIWFFRSMQDIRANRLWKIRNTATTPSYYSSANFQVAGRDRELPRNPGVWRDVTNFAKEDTDTRDEFSSMNWGLGAIAPRRFPGHESQVTGAVNFTTADRPTFYMNLNTVPLDPLTGSPNTELRVIVEGKAEFNTDGLGRAELFMA
jgi:hypothetical protein